MGEKEKRKNDAAELDALYRQIEHAKDEDGRNPTYSVERALTEPTNKALARR